MVDRLVLYIEKWMTLHFFMVGHINARIFVSQKTADLNRAYSWVVILGAPEPDQHALGGGV